jgi:peptidoglycan/LPS O-acetylase OafA/YrhL
MFFVLSGFLIALQGIREMRRTNKLNYLGFLWARWWRICPTYIASIIANVIFDIQNSRECCGRSWWANLLFVNNLQGHGIGFEDGVPDTICMLWTWSIALEFQFYFLTPGILMLCCNRDGSARRYAFPLLILFICCFLAVRAGIFFGLSPDGKTVPNQMTNVLWTRGHTYLMGVGACIAYNEKLGRGPSMLYVVLDVLAYPLGILMAFLGNGGAQYRMVWTFSPFLAKFQIIFSQALFALAVSWGCFRAVSDCAPWLNSFLSAKFWIPFARLSYTAYLMQFCAINPLYNNWKIFFKGTPMVDGFFLWIDFYVVAVILVFLVALVHHLLFEAPSLNMRKAVTPKCLER